MSFDLRLGDCLDLVSGLASLPDKSVDVCITDPPYEAEAHTDGRRQKGCGPNGYVEVRETPLDFLAITPEQRAGVAVQIARVTRHRALVFCQAEAVGDWKTAFNAAGMPYRRSIPWTKPDAMPSLHGRWPGQAYEAMVLAMYPSAPSCPVGGKSRLYEYTRANNGRTPNPHPTTKPLGLMRDIVIDFTDPGDLILDPFAGSGTTGVAAIQLGRRFIGWEKDAAYHEIAMRRLRGDEAKPRPEQPSLFGGVA